MKKILMICCLLAAFLSNLKAEVLELNLTDFSIYASEENKVNILIDEALSDKNFIFTINDKSDYYLPAFEKALSIHNLELVKSNNVYYVRDIKTFEEKRKYRAIKLNFVNYEDIKNFLQVYENTKFEFISTSKLLMVYSNELEYNSIKDTIEQIDTLPKQLKLKITIVETNLDKLREYGSDSSILNIDDNSNFFFNLIAYPFSSTNQIPVNQKSGFYSFLKYVNDDGISNFLSNPILTLSDGTPTVLNVVNTLPFKTGTSTIEDTNYKTSNSYEYRDVGLQININPSIYKDDNVYLDLELNVSTLLENKDDMPTTSKKYIKQRFHLSKDNIFVLSGLNQTEKNTKDIKVPLLSEIPFLGWFFKYEYKKENNRNLSIVFELVENIPNSFVKELTTSWN